MLPAELGGRVCRFLFVRHATMIGTESLELGGNGHKPPGQF